MIWTRDKRNESSIIPLSKPSESSKYIDESIQTLLRLINFEAYNKNNKELSNLLLARQVVSGELELSHKQIILSSIRQKLFQRKNRITVAAKTISPSNHKKVELDQSEDSIFQHPIKSQKKIGGHIDGFGKSRALRGWVDAHQFGAHPPSIQIAVSYTPLPLPTILLV